MTAAIRAMQNALREIPQEERSRVADALENIAQAIGDMDRGRTYALLEVAGLVRHGEYRLSPGTARDYP